MFLILAVGGGVIPTVNVFWPRLFSILLSVIVVIYVLDIFWESLDIISPEGFKTL